MNVSTHTEYIPTIRSDSPSSSYQQLLVRTKRVREARDEAKREITEYKTQKEDEYQKFEAEVRI